MVPRGRNTPRPQVHGDVSNLVTGTSKYQGAKASGGNQDLPGTRDHPVNPSRYSDSAHIYAHAQQCREPGCLSSSRPSDRKELPALPASGGPAVASVMSWVQAASLVQGPEEEREVFDEEADESLLVQREWRSHMQRRVKVNLRGGAGVHCCTGLLALELGVVRRWGPRMKAGVVAAWSGAALPLPYHSVWPMSC